MILASGSPRRRELLERLGIAFEVRPPEVDERHRPGESPEAYVGRLAREKIGAAPPCEAIVLAADTAVVLDGSVDSPGTILGKPRDRGEATAMLDRLSGGWHRVLTGVAVRPPPRADGTCAEPASLRVDTRVLFRPLTKAQRAWYVATGEGADKAGGYAIQGLGAALVERIEGSYTNVVGLPLAETLSLLEAAGLRLPWSAGVSADAPRGSGWAGTR